MGTPLKLYNIDCWHTYCKLTNEINDCLSTIYISEFTYIINHILLSIEGDLMNIIHKYVP